MQMPVDAVGRQCLHYLHWQSLFVLEAIDVHS
jgi:hypothetical protein